MIWEVVELTSDTFLVQDGHVIVGSMAHADGKWMVEILWSGPSGDIRFSGTTKIGALAFIEGVQKTTLAMRDMQ